MNQHSENKFLFGPPAGEHWVIDNDVVDVSRPAPVPSIATIQALPQTLRVDLRKSAVIIVDMQNDFVHPDGWMAGAFGIDTSAAAQLANPINQITNSARQAEMPVLWLNWGVRDDQANLPPITRYPFSDRRNFGGLGDEVAARKNVEAHALLGKDSWGAQIMDGLDVGPDDIHVDKHRISGFWDTPLDSILRHRNIKTLFFAGINSDHCVLGTLMDACFLGYDTIMVEDATGTSSPDFCHQAAIHNVRFCFGFTTTFQDLTSGLSTAEAIR